MRAILRASLSFMTLSFLLGISSCFSSNQRSQVQGYISSKSERREVSTSVCWQTVETSTALSRTMVQEVIQIEFSKVGIHFVGFGPCSESPADIEVIFTRGQSASRVDSIGRDAHFLYLETEKFSCKNDMGQAIPYLGSNCFTNVALHEFGHLTGLHHEMNRPDRSECLSADQHFGEGEDFGVQIGDFDPLSIMNYCRVWDANKANVKLGLSPGDLLTLRELYFGVLAGVSTSTPRKGPPEKLMFDVVGEGVHSARVSFGKEGLKDCKNVQNYRLLPRLQQIDMQVLLAVFPEITLEAADYRICILAQDDLGHDQRTELYSSRNYEVKIFPQTPVLFSVQSSQVSYDLSTQSPRVQVSGQIDGGFDKVVLSLSHPDLPMLSIESIGYSDDKRRLVFVFDRQSFPVIGAYFLAQMSFFSGGEVVYSMGPGSGLPALSVNSSIFEISALDVDSSMGM